MSGVRWMRRALSLAEESARFAAHPRVGAVLVKDGRAVGEGCYRGPGHPHAEAEALERAGESARGAVLYVNLEPCAHEGRTPPCAELLIARGVSRVASALEDPDERVSGRGHARLREAGVAVETGMLAEKASRLNAPYLKWKREGLPFAAAKIAMSLDGRTALASGESKWITSEAARLDGRRLRSRHDALLIGVGTALADDPRLTCRLPAEEGPYCDPVRVVADTHARVRPTARLLREAGRAVLAVGEAAPASRTDALERAGAEVWRLPLSEGRVCLRALLRRLGEKGLLAVLAEGGSSLLGSLVRGGFADQVTAYIAPLIIGGDGLPAVGALGLSSLSEALRIESWEARSIPPDIRIDGYAPPR